MLWQIVLVDQQLKADNGLAQFQFSHSATEAENMLKHFSMHHTYSESVLKDSRIHTALNSSEDFDENMTPAPMLHEENSVDRETVHLPNINKPHSVSTNKQRRNSETNLLKSRTTNGASLRMSSDNTAFIPEIDHTVLLNSTRKPALPMFKMKSSFNIGLPKH